jgi:endonuclease YncB( thermonuclease family)
LLRRSPLSPLWPSSTATRSISAPSATGCSASTRRRFTGPCDAERRRGELTKRRLETLAGSGRVDLRADRPGQRDRYGRLLVRLFVNGEDAACVLIKEGYARPWRGRRENWCVNIDPRESMARIVCAVAPPAAPPASPN